jgi:hypothetical protein
MACATDAGRHERMLDITGGDVAALNEVTITLDLLAAQDDPDLTAAVSLARDRDYLADRNTNIPTQLPAVWATLGQHIRAEALARSITDPYQRAQALTIRPRPWPAPSPVCTCRRGRWRRWPGCWPKPACTGRPRPWPAPSPIRTGRRGRWRRCRGTGGEGRHKTGASRGLDGVCRWTVDHGAGTGVVAGANGAKNAHRVLTQTS